MGNSITTMFSRAIVLALALVASATAFAPANFGARVVRGAALDANVLDTASTLVGPDIFWGSDGVLEGHDENEIKGQDGFGKFVAACNAAGLGATLAGPGPFTVFAPTDAAMDAAAAVGRDTTSLAAMQYHVVNGAVSKGSISGDLATLSGATLTYKRFARQTFLDDAVVGAVPQGAATGSSYPVDIQCDNGVVHAIDQVLIPGYSKNYVETIG